MPNLIDREAIISLIEKVKDDKSIPKNYGLLLDILMWIRQLPATESEPVVHCKDCKYLLKNKMLCLHKENRVFNTGIIVHNNHYCSYGAKMDEEVKE